MKNIQNCLFSTATSEFLTDTSTTITTIQTNQPDYENRISAIEGLLTQYNIGFYTENNRTFTIYGGGSLSPATVDLDIKVSRLGSNCTLVVSGYIGLTDCNYIAALSALPANFRPPLGESPVMPVLAAIGDFDSDILGYISVDSLGTINIRRNANVGISDRWNGVNDGFVMMHISYFI